MSFGSSGSGSTSSAYGWNQSENRNSVEGGSSGSSSSTQAVDQSQQPWLEGLYQAGADRTQTSQDATDQLMPILSDVSGQMMGQGQLDSAMGIQQGVAGGMNPALSQLGGMASGAGEMGALDAYSNRVSQNFNNQIMTGINSQAGQANAIGGSRQGVAQGVAAGQARQQMQDFAGEQYNQNQNRRLSAAGQQGQQYMQQDQNRLSAAQGMGQQFEQANQRRMGAMGQMSGFQDMYMKPLQQYRDVVGPTNVLTQGQSQQGSFNNIDSYGYNMGEQSEEKFGNSSEMNFGIPFL
jgi:hypothetical protein